MSKEAAVTTWSELHKPVPDLVFRLDGLAKKAPEPKINLVIGAYRDGNGLPHVLDVVHKAEHILCDDPAVNKEYLPIDGYKAFSDASMRLLLGDDLFKEKASYIASCQALSGTGACRLIGEFYARACPRGKKTRVLLSNPTWANHRPIFRECGFTDIGSYTYFDPATKGVAMHKMLEDLESAPEQSIVVLHLCAHNPTGADPSIPEWRQIATVIKRKKHFAMFDSAYQGYASGDLARDAYAARLFVSKGIEFCIAQSFAKNMGLYCERVGCASVVTNNIDVVPRVRGLLKNIARPMYSNPPAHGARVAFLIMSDAEMRKEWEEELKEMADRIIRMREVLHRELLRLGTPGDWGHIVKQIGMFSYTGLDKAQCAELIKRRVFLLPSGRISVAGLTESTAKLLAGHIDDILKHKSSKL